MVRSVEAFEEIHSLAGMPEAWTEMSMAIDIDRYPTSRHSCRDSDPFAVGLGKDSCES